MTAFDERTFYAAIVTRLGTSTGKNIGLAEAPANVTTPYSVVWPLDPDDDPDSYGDLSDAHAAQLYSWQVTSVGATTDEALWMQQKVRAALLGWSPTVSGLTCAEVERSGGQGLTRDDDLRPPVFYAIDRFVCFAA